jgi:hypothetical protein
MASSTADAGAGLGLDLEYLKFQISISSAGKLSAVTVSSNVKFDNVKILKSSDGYELWSQKMSVILDAMGFSEIVVLGIDPLPLVSAEELITIQLAHRQGLLVITQVVSNDTFGEIANLKNLHDMWIYLRMSYRRDSILSYVVALRSFMRIEQRISRAMVLMSECIFTFETEWNRLAHHSQSSAAGSSTYRKTLKDLFACQDAKRDVRLG